jgi:hypothetical protein
VHKGCAGVGFEKFIRKFRDLDRHIHQGETVSPLPQKGAINKIEADYFIPCFQKFFWRKGPALPAVPAGEGKGDGAELA